MQSLETLTAAQSSRRPPARVQATESSRPRERALDVLHERNQILDFFFYDLRVVKKDEAVRLGAETADEGVILSVGPSSNPHLKVLHSVEEFLDTHPTEIGAITVSGVGSSALGSAAFARNVADAIHKPALAVVSGRGVSDFVAEALGGFFWFGLANSIRHMLAPFEQILQADETARGSVTGEAPESTAVAAIRNSKDVRTLVALLNTGLPCELLVGHSKGNLVISEALFALQELDPARLADLGRYAKVITVSARIAMPNEFEDVIDIMGKLDPLGELNSRRWISNDIEELFASHHTNTELPLPLPVTEKVSEALTMSGGRPASRT